MEELPDGLLDRKIENKIKETYKEVGEDIEKLEFKLASDKAMQLVEIANKYYDDQKPWIQRKENIEEFNNTIYTCATIIANLSNIFEPFMPKACEKIREYLKINEKTWDLIKPEANIKLENIEPLFERITD